MMIMNIIKTNKTRILKGLVYGALAVTGAIALVVVVAGKLGTDEVVVEDEEVVFDEIVDIEADSEE